MSRTLVSRSLSGRRRQVHDGVSKATQSVQLLGIVKVGDNTKRALVSQLIQTLCLTGDCKNPKAVPNHR
jgi:hypothetical protein